MGEKPLYYAQVDGLFCFASEIKALFEHPQLIPQVNHSALPFYLTLGYIPPPITMFKDIHKLAAGEQLIYENQQLHSESYWLPEMNTSRPSLSYEDTVALVRQAVEKSVISRMVSDVSVGAFLSGGVDSTAVSAIMQAHTSQALNTFTVGFDMQAGSIGDQKFNNDLRHSDIAARYIGTHHHKIILKSDAICNLLPHLIYQLDEPIAQHSIIQTVYVAALARHYKVPVLVSGDCGDELFLGYEHYQADQTLARYMQIPPLLRNAVLNPLLSKSPIKSQQCLNMVRKSSYNSFAERYLEWMRIMFTDTAAQLIGEAKEEIQDLLNTWMNPILEMPETCDFADRIAYLSARWWIAEDSNMRVDKMCMLMSVESRAPLEDHELVDIAFNLPLKYKLRDGDVKRVFKDAVRDLVPSPVLTRPKSGFNPPMSDWLRHELSPLIDRYLSPEYVAVAGMCNPDIVQKIVDEHRSKRVYHMKPLWSLLVLHLWYALYIDKSLTLAEKLTPKQIVDLAVIETL